MMGESASIRTPYVHLPHPGMPADPRSAATGENGKTRLSGARRARCQRPDRPGPSSQRPGGWAGRAPGGPAPRPLKPCYLPHRRRAHAGRPASPRGGQPPLPPVIYNPPRSGVGAGHPTGRRPHSGRPSPAAATVRWFRGSVCPLLKTGSAPDGNAGRFGCLVTGAVCHLDRELERASSCRRAVQLVAGDLRGAW